MSVKRFIPPVVVFFGNPDEIPEGWEPINESARIETLNFEHTYLTKGFDVLNEKAKRTHACLRMGYWCWKNALENPLLAIKYLLKKMKGNSGK